jgi:hypothetical protein
MVAAAVTAAAMKRPASVEAAAMATAMPAAAMRLCIGRLQRHGKKPRRSQDRHAARHS